MYAPTCLTFLAPGMGMAPFEMHQFRATWAGVLSLSQIRMVNKN